MDINSRINWKPGMEITAQTFNNLYQDFLDNQQLAIKATMGNIQIGLLGNTPFNNTGSFVKNSFEIPDFQCTALLPSGVILDVKESVQVPIPMLFGDVYYLTVGMSKEFTEFERKDIPYIRPKYLYEIHSFEELKDLDAIPVVRFLVKDGVFELDYKYIPPTLQLICDNRFQDYVNQIAQKIEKLNSHPKLVDKYGRRELTHFYFTIKNFNLRNKTYHFIFLTYELVKSVSFYIQSLTNSEKSEQVPTPSQYDLEKWLSWVINYLDRAAIAFDEAVVTEKKINYDELKEQIKTELYNEMKPELHNLLFEQLKQELNNELSEKLTKVITDYFEGTLKPALGQRMGEMSDELYNKLYKGLYDALYASLFVPQEKEEEDTFMPLI